MNPYPGGARDLPPRHLLSIADLGPDDLSGLIDAAVAIGKGEGADERPLAGKVVGILFRNTSTRTRTAFTVGALHLGAATITYGPGDLQLATGETASDTARVLASYLDVLVVRSHGCPQETFELARQDGMAIVNALDDREHPTQALADLAAIKEALGRCEGIHILYLGEANCSARSLALAVAQIPRMRLTLVTPAGYGLEPAVLEQAATLAARCGGRVEQQHDPVGLPQLVDCVYTSRWLEMGKAKTDPDWLEKFRPYTVDSALMARVSRPGGTVFMHDLPAMRGYEVTDAVLDGAQSIAFRQAFHKMTSAMAVLDWCTREQPARRRLAGARS